jgi:hypothetical protein
MGVNLMALRSLSGPSGSLGHRSAPRRWVIFVNTYKVGDQSAQKYSNKIQITSKPTLSCSSITGLKVLGRLSWPNRLMAWLGSHGLARLSGLTSRLDQQAGSALWEGFSPNRPFLSILSLSRLTHGSVPPAAHW